MKTRHSLLSLALLGLNLIPAVALGAGGQIEINATCAVQTGCFAGDSPGYPVLITESGSYRLTSSLHQNEIVGFSTPSTAIQIAADGVDIDLGGFTISCANPIVGSCSGSALGIGPSGSGRDATRIANGRVDGMPGGGIHLGTGDGGVVENVRVSDTGGVGISAGIASRIVGSTSFGNAYQGISVTGHSVVVQNNAYDNGLSGISAISSVVAENTSSYNGGNGISASNSVVRDNQVASNAGDGIEAPWQARVTNNVSIGNGGYGLEVTNSSISGNFVNGNAGGTILGGIDVGGNACDLNATCP